MSATKTYKSSAVEVYSVSCRWTEVVTSLVGRGKAGWARARLAGRVGVVEQGCGG